jgi:hypothetical protein
MTALIEKIDWSIITSFTPYAIVDPLASDNILYLTTDEYKKIVIIALSRKSFKLTVLVTPTTVRPTNLEGFGEL